MKDAQNKLPKGWAPTNIGEICTALQYGYTASASDEACGPRFLRITDIQNGRVQWASVPYCEIDDSQVAKYALRAGDIVFARTGGTVGKSFIITSVPEQSVFASYLIRLSAHPAIEPKFLYYFFQSTSYWEQIGLKKGGLQGNVNATTLSSLELSVCPLNEQRRIVVRVEELFSELDEGVESLTAAQEKLKVYRQAVLYHAFEGKLTAEWRQKNKKKLKSPDQLIAGVNVEREARYQQQLVEWKAAIEKWEANRQKGKKPSKPRKPETISLDNNLLPVLPAEWIWVPVGNLNADVFDGPFGSNLKTSDYVDDGVRVIRLENIGYLEFLDEKHSYVTVEKYKSLKNHTVRAGDIIFSSFVTDGIRVTVLPGTVTCAINKADCFCLRVHGDAVRNDFPASFLSSRIAYKQIESEVHGIGRPRINTTQLKGFAVPLCSREEQDEIMSRLREKWSLADNVEAVIQSEIIRCETLRQSILKSAFSGHLVAHDPNDEPASVLLERIQAEKDGRGKHDKNNKRKDAA